jgi:hypothetical protein
MRRSNVESDHSEFDHWAGAKHLLIRIRLLRAYQVILLAGLLLAAGEAISAQSVGKSPSQPPQPASVQTPQSVQPTQASDDNSAKPQTPPQPALKFADVVQKVKDEGRSTSIGSYIAEGVGIKNTQIDSSPVQARVLSDTDRELCVVEDTGALLFLIRNGQNTEVYLANHAGVLQTAGYFYPGRFHSQEFKGVSKQKAAAGFAAEKELWIKKISPTKPGDAVKTEEHLSTPDKAKPEAPTKEKTKAVKSKKQSKAEDDDAPPKKKISWF